jgi:L-lactate dehydrogenase complex protein LldG
MLTRVRAALGGSPSAGSSSRYDSIPPVTGPIISPVGPDPVANLESELRKLGVATYRASTRLDFHGLLGSILTAAGTTSAVISRNPILLALGVESHLRAAGITVARWPAASGTPLSSQDEASFRAQAFAAQIGITGVDCALAESGSLILSSATEGSQLASLTPPIHVAIYRPSQVLQSLEEVLGRLAQSGGPDAPNAGRSVVFISGTSRTADIEQILIRGVHGPQQVHAIMVEDSCLG